MRQNSILRAIIAALCSTGNIFAARFYFAQSIKSFLNLGYAAKSRDSEMPEISYSSLFLNLIQINTKLSNNYYLGIFGIMLQSRDQDP